MAVSFSFRLAVEVGFGDNRFFRMAFVKHVGLQGIDEFRFRDADTQAIKRTSKERVLRLRHAKRSLGKKPEPERLAGIHSFVQLDELGQVNYNIFIFGENGEGGARFYIMFAEHRPRIPINFRRFQDREIAKPNRNRLGQLVIPSLFFVFGQRFEVFRLVVVVLAADGQVGIVQLHSVAKKRMQAVLQLNVNEPVVLGGNPGVKTDWLRAGHEHINVLFELVFKIDDFAGLF